MINSIKDCAQLNNGLKMPWLGFGVFKVPDGDVAEKAVRDALEAGCQVLVEKPISVTVAEADELVRLARERRLTLMVGHLERFNSAMEELKTRVTAPRFIESHRLAFFKERGTDVDVVLDLMIHDLDHVLNLVPSPVKEIRAAGISILTDRIDLANARLAGLGAAQSLCAGTFTEQATCQFLRRPARLWRRYCMVPRDRG